MVLCLHLDLCFICITLCVGCDVEVHVPFSRSWIDGQFYQGLHPLNCLCTFAKNQLAISVHVYFWSLFCYFLKYGSRKILNYIFSPHSLSVATMASEHEWQHRGLASDPWESWPSGEGTTSWSFSAEAANLGWSPTLTATRAGKDDVGRMPQRPPSSSWPLLGCLLPSLPLWGAVYNPRAAVPPSSCPAISPSPSCLVWMLVYCPNALSLLCALWVISFSLLFRSFHVFPLYIHNFYPLDLFLLMCNLCAHVSFSISLWHIFHQRES